MSGVESLGYISAGKVTHFSKSRADSSTILGSRWGGCSKQFVNFPSSTSNSRSYKKIGHRLSTTTKAHGGSPMPAYWQPPTMKAPSHLAATNIVVPTVNPLPQPELLEDSGGLDSCNSAGTGKEMKWGKNPLQQLAASALNLIERSVIPHIESQIPLPSTADPNIQLAGNFRPVPESPVQDGLEVLGTLPESLEGVYLRNGANPQFEPLAGHHFFDGDGMIHAVHFKGGEASHCCRFTQTYRFQEEKKEGRAFFPKAIGELHGHSGVARLMLYGARCLAGLVDPKQGMGVANAGLVYHNGRLLAMSEDDLPYLVTIREDGDLETKGRFDFDGQYAKSMIAHPKIDPETGELFALSYDVIKPPYLQYFRISSDGVKTSEVSITLPEATMMHDFAITENYVVIPDQQVVFRMKEMLTGGSPVVHDPTKMSRFGVLPKYDSDESRIRWIDVPDCFCFHLWNSWEEGDEVVVLGSRMTPADSIFNDHSDASSLQSLLTEIRLNLKTGESSQRVLANFNLEAAQLNRNYVGKKNRYLYLAIAEPWPKISGIAKVDMEAKDTPDGAVVGKNIYEEGSYGGEPVFVPRTSDPDAAEDDGYILTFRHNESKQGSELLVLDASKPSLDVIAVVKLPSRVPYGLHGTFINANDLAKQRSCS
ncbi:unnamed protein product [Calypogeia fissa]